MATMDTSCLYTTIKNISGATMKFGFLPPHGLELADDEQVTVFGHLTEAVNRGDRSGARFMQALETSIGAGQLDIEETPAAIIWDSGASKNVTLAVTSGSATYPDPCWDSEL